MFTKKMAFTYFVTVILIFNTGWIDSVVLYNSFGASVAVMSGNLRILGHSMAGADWVFMYKVAILVFGFVVGAAVNGVLMKTDAYVISEDHTKTLVLQSAVMLTGTLLIDIFSNHRIIDDLFLAVAMGMQNSFTTIFFGGFARTTHMTGTTTDLGIEIGRVLRGDKSNVWKIPFFATCMTMFVIGNAAGVVWVNISGHNYTLMLFPSVVLPIFVGIVILLTYNMKVKNHRI
ncbi:membrane protein [Candidatus Francisella endociliophora]|uniref:Membrane protein n=1 Tax=Candidatus Francisella endociliophora TaxID=653937 RepID=A0A097EQ29_9GAMM|nr:YoaK family protein [Francisella sp. FSC1006]AIT09672.1 membrane protein [Francisella sp. FSC1006]